MEKKDLLIISTGGTIAQVIDKETGVAVISNEEGKKKDAKTFGDVLADTLRYAGLTYDAKPIKNKDGSELNKDSSNIVPDDWVQMIDTIVENYENYDSFLITHGTNTLGYTCAALSFALGNVDKPVLLTGSQISYGYPGSDAQLNLENAVKVAAYKEHRLAGVMAVFGSQIISGTRVKKTTDFDYDAFKSFGKTPLIGRVGRKVTIDNEALDSHLRWLEPRFRNKRDLDRGIQNQKLYNPKIFSNKIASLTEFPGMSSDIFRALVQTAKVEGIILRASGAGDPNIAKESENHLYENLRDGFEFLKLREIPILVTTHAPDGIASMDVNDPGELALQLGAIPAWDMSIEAMTVKFMWLLGQGLQYNEIQHRMLNSLKGEIYTTRI